MYVIIAILMFGILIAVHELGHFICAKLCGVRVNEFAIGMGPALFKKRRGETLYALRVLPLGGYCAMEGENGGSDDPRSLEKQSVIKKLVIFVAGAFMNFLMGLLLIAIMYSGAQAFVTPTIVDFREGCPYEGADALQKGDTFYKIDGERVYLSSDVSDFLNTGETVHDLVMLRNGEKVSLDGFEMVMREYEKGEGAKYGFSFGYEEATFGVKLRYVWNTALEFSRWVRLGLSDLLSGKVSVDEMAGPVGIVDLMNDVGQQAETTRIAVSNLLYLSAFIAINLALMNMLPIPALDGGRVFFLLVTAVIEAITKKKVDPKYETFIHTAGLLLLLLFMIFIMFNDILRIFTR